MTALQLRRYQSEAIDALFAAWGRGVRRPAVVLPTAMGKTVIFSNLITRWRARPRPSARRDAKPLVLVHRDELIGQAADKIRQADPGVRIGIIKAERNELDADCYVASVQTLSRERRIVQIDPWRVGLIIVDECHHAAADSYLRILQYFGCYGSGAVAAGFTATMSREDGRRLGDVWQEVVYTKDILWGIESKYLRDVRAEQVMIDGLDLTTVARSAGDFQDTSLGEALELSGAGERVAEAYRTRAVLEGEPNGLRRGILFAPTVRAAEYFAAEFAAAGIPGALILGETPREDRALAYKRMREGEINLLHSCGVLTEGFDMPQASCAVMARPTQSQGLYVQMAGRVLRPWQGIPDALLLDVSGVTGNHRLAGVSDLTMSDIRPKDGESLAEALDRTMKEADAKASAFKRTAERRKLLGALEYAEVDPFDRSHSAWLWTEGGIPFIQTHDLTWFLWPHMPAADGSERWRVGVCPNRTTRGGQWPYVDMSLEYAMAHAERDAYAHDPSISQRSAPWRRRKVEPDAPQRAMARRLGIQVPEDARKGPVSDAISVKLVSRLLDRKAKGVRR